MGNSTIQPDVADRGNAHGKRRNSLPWASRKRLWRGKDVIQRVLALVFAMARSRRLLDATLHRNTTSVSNFDSVKPG